MAIVLIIIFALGYAAIAAEHIIHINKAAIALVTGILGWTVYAIAMPGHEVAEDLTSQLAEISGILFFLMGAMAVVELVDTCNGFDVITEKITQTNKRKLLWIISLLAFSLSPVLDNLTTTIVMVLLVRKLIADREDRHIFISMVIIAANAGGIWSPIGDVTTTMLWIGGQITAPSVSIHLFLPSLACMLVPLSILSLRTQGMVERPINTHGDRRKFRRKHQYIVLFTSILILFLVPVFKAVTHLPPYMGILFGLGILWVLTEIIRRQNHFDRDMLSVAYALQKIDTPSILFFLGILLSVASLQTAGVLAGITTWMDSSSMSEGSIVGATGLLSAIIDNVPLVAAMQKMYPLTRYPTDHFFWQFLAYCTGSGGSILIIGSAAGVAAMGMEKIKFLWYMKKISILALSGFFAGVGVYLLQRVIFM